MPVQPEPVESASEIVKRLDEALASHDTFIALRPDDAEAFNSRGIVLWRLARLDEALASYGAAIALKPDYAEAYYNRGITLADLNQYAAALASYDAALTLQPMYPEAFNNRGLALLELNRLDEAQMSFDRAIALKPDYALAYFNRGCVKLLRGELQEGWADYEWRWKSSHSREQPSDVAAPEWQGDDVSGRHILVYSEQGWGDVIQFARFLPLLAERGATVTFLVDRKLVRLMRPLSRHIKVTAFIRRGQLFDCQCALMSLPKRLDIVDHASLPNRVPYLHPEAELAAHWKQRIGPDGLKVGIVWQGRTVAKGDVGKSIPLKAFLPLCRVPGVRLISLQKHHGLEQLADLPADAKIENPGDGFSGETDEFVDTAAIMSSLDLVITSDTSTAHLAGALARPTWVALKHVPDWRWLTDREDCPWYPTMRLFRQNQKDGWQTVFSSIEQELRRPRIGA
jgi:hypothetical protein